MGLDILDFIKDRGGDPEKIRKSQRDRHAPEEVVDEVIALYEDHRKSEKHAFCLGRLLITGKLHMMPHRSEQRSTRHKKKLALRRRSVQYHDFTMMLSVVS